MYYVYGNSKQKMKIHKRIYSFENIILNSILRSEIGRVLINSFFKLKKNIKSYISIEKNILIDDFWIDMTQKINKIRSNQLHKSLFSIIQYYRNKFDKVPLDASDSFYVEKEIDRIDAAIDKMTEELMDFQDEILSWQFKDNFSCNQANWEIIFNKNTFDYEFKYNNSCLQKYCPQREKKLINLIQNNKSLFLRILKEGKEMNGKDNMALDEKLYITIEKLINIHSNKQKFNFTRKYCYHLGDFLISLLLVKNSHRLFTYNLKHFYFLFHFLGIDQNRIIAFST